MGQSAHLEEKKNKKTFSTFELLSKLPIRPM